MTLESIFTTLGLSSETTAQAQTASPGSPAPQAPKQSTLGMFLPMIIIFAIFYMLMIRPQQKQRKQQQILLQGVKKGDEIITTGGVLGKVTKVADDFISIEIAANTVVQIQRQAVQTLLPKNTIKAI